MAAVSTGNAGRFTTEAEHSPFGDGVSAQDVEIELHGVIYDAGQCADNQVNGGDTPGAVLPGRLQRNVQYALSHREFVHGSPPDLGFGTDPLEFIIMEFLYHACHGLSNWSATPNLHRQYRLRQANPCEGV